MQKRVAVILVAAMLALAGGDALAAGKSSSSKSSTLRLYKYRNASGVLVIESAIPPEFARNGYQVVDGAGRVIQDVPAAPTDAQKASEKQAQELSALSSRRDGELRKLYSSPQDAERLRDRQLEALSLKMDFTRGQLQQVSSKRRTDLEQAAKLERKGQAVPNNLRDSIGSLGRQVADLELQLKQLEGERVRIRGEFDPVIERLKIIYPDKVATGVPTTPGAVAPVAAPPATAPAAPAAPVAAPKAAR